MRKLLKIGILCALFIVCSCPVLAQKSENAPNEATQKSEKKEELLSAFSFWIKLSTTTSSGGLILALLRAIDTARP